MKLHFAFKNKPSGKSLLVETVRRALVRNATEINIDTRSLDIRLSITGHFTEEQIRGIKEYAQYFTVE